MIKTFRGLLADGGEDRIRLSTTDGKVGYKIVKFQLMTENPGTTDYEHIGKIYKTSQTAIVGSIDLTEASLLAAAYTEGHGYLASPQIIIFDNVVFNQDIYVSQFDTKGAFNCNYYIELEVVPLTELGAEYTTLKDLRVNS